MQKPLATVVIGGLISATVLTVLVLPALSARFGSGAAAAPAPASVAKAPQMTSCGSAE